MEFSRQEYWNGLLFPSSGDLPDPGIEPGSPALQADALLSEPPGNPLGVCGSIQILGLFVLFLWKMSLVVLFIGRLLITDSVSLFVLCLFRFSVSSWFSFGRLYVSRNFCLFFLNLLVYNFSQFINDPLYFVVSFVTASLLFFICLNLFSFLWRVSRKVYLLKKLVLSFSNLFYYFLLRYFIYFCSDL